MFGMFEIAPHMFNNIQVWGPWWPFQNLHLSFLEVLYGWFRGMLWIIIWREYPTSLQLQCLDWPSNISSRMYWYLVGSILPSSRTIFPVPPAATQPQSIMDPPLCLTVTKVFSPNIPPNISPNIPSSKFHFGFVSPKHIVPKGFRLVNVFFGILQTLNFVLRLFFLATAV